MAANRDLELLVRLIGDTSAIRKDVAGVNSTLGKLGGTVAKLGAGLGLAYGAREAIRFLGDAAAKGSELAEAQSKVDAVFGDSARAVRRWAADLDSSFGISERQATSFVGTYGQVAKAMGLTAAEAADLSQGFVELAGDLASFSDVPIDQALNALRSGLAGETEPLKALGIVLNETLLRERALAEGIIGTNRALSTREKALAIEAELYRQTADAQGDAARTADTYAGKQRQLNARLDNLQTSLGTKLQPLVLGLTEGAIWLVDNLQTALDNLQRILDAAAFLGSAIDARMNNAPLLDPQDAAQAIRDMEALARAQGDLLPGGADELFRRLREEVGLTVPPLSNVQERLELMRAVLEAGFLSSWADESERVRAVTEAWNGVLAPAAEAAADLGEGTKDAASGVQALGAAMGTLQGDSATVEKVAGSGGPLADLKALLKDVRKARVQAEKLIQNPEKFERIVRKLNREYKSLQELLPKAVTQTKGPTKRAVTSLINAALGRIEAKDQAYKDAGQAQGLAYKRGFLRGAALTAAETNSLVPTGTDAEAAGFRAGATAGFTTVNLNITGDPLATSTRVVDALRRYGADNGGRMGRTLAAPMTAGRGLL